MPVHDISKISPPILSKQLSIRCTCHPLHLGLLAHPAERYAIFGPGGACTPFSFHLLFLGGDVISVPTGQTDNRELCYSWSAAGDRRRNMQEFVPRVTQGQGYPRLQKPVCVCERESLILGLICIIFNINLVDWGAAFLLRLTICCFWFGFTAVPFIMS